MTTRTGIRRMAAMLGLLLVVVAPARAEVLDRIVAVVNAEPITQREVEELMLPFFAAPEEDRSLSSEEMQQAREAALRQLIDERLVVQAARQAKIQVSDEEIDGRFHQVRDRFGTPEAFEQELAKQGMTRQDLLTRFHEQLMARRLIEQQVRSKITVGPTEAEQYYAAHPDEFTMPEEVQARHILIRVNEERADAAARQLINDLHAQLLANNGATFAELAKRHSQAPEAEQGGDLGWVKRGQLMADLDAPLFALAVNGLSAPIHTKLGYHLLQATDRHEGGKQLLEAVRVQVEDRIFAEKFKAAFDGWMAKLRDQAYIQVN